MAICFWCVMKTRGRNRFVENWNGIFCWRWLQLQMSDPFVQMVYTRKGKEILYLMTHSTHFIYGYMALDIW